LHFIPRSGIASFACPQESRGGARSIVGAPRHHGVALALVSKPKSQNILRFVARERQVLGMGREC
jgi:hypothetical protein